jgi:hypothetical protein
MLEKPLWSTMRRIVFLAVFLAGASVQESPAQDSNYWDNQYGTKGELLGGIVVGTPNDLSATYYNPGWIALQVDPSLLMTTLSVEGYSIKLEDVLGDGTNPVSTTFTTSPGYLAGRFTLSKDRNWQWAYSYLQKVKFDFDAVGIRIGTINQPPPGGPLQFSGEAFRKSKTNEYWYGLTFSRKIRPNMGLGFTPYVVQRSMNSRTQASTQGLDLAADYGQVYRVDEFNFWHVRLVAKIGLAIDRGNLTYGLTVTTPGLGLFGSGKVLTTETHSGLDLNDDGAVDPAYLSSNYQEKLSATWKSPLSIASGLSLRSGATKVHLTVEWFNAVKVSQAMNPDPYHSQSDPNEIRTYHLAYGAKSLINYGLAVEHVFNPKFALYGAFRSDYSSVPSDEVDNLQISNWDLWHMSGGASFAFLNMEFTAGLQYSFGSGTSERFINFGLDNGGHVIGNSASYDISYRRLKAIIGFNLPFGEAGN